MVDEKNWGNNQLSDFSIYEVSPRDGLQNLDHIVPTTTKVSLIDYLVEAGLKRIEVGSFVHPKLVPNMADSDEIYSHVAAKHRDCELGVLVPNKRGMKRARSIGVRKINIFMSPSESFNNRNHNDTTYGVYQKYKEVLVNTPKSDVRVYLSCVFGCPMTDYISQDDMIRSLEWADEFGDTIVLSDTAGKATPNSIKSLILLTRSMGVSAKIALHLHHGEDVSPMHDKLDMAYDMGIRDFDSSVCGLGGCPFVDGSHGNLATEDLINWAENRGLRSSIDRERLDSVISFVNSHIRKAKEALQLSV